MYKRLLVLCAIAAMLSQVAVGDMWFRGTFSGASWTDVNNWYTDYTLTTNTGSLPGSGDRVYSVPDAADWVGVPTTDPDATDPCTDVNMYITQAAESYYNWTRQIINIDNTSVACKDMRLGMGKGGEPGDTLQRIELNIINSSTLTCAGALSPGRNDYCSGEAYIDATSSVIAADYESRGSYHQITSVAGSMILSDELDMSSGCGWAFDTYYGTIYCDFGDGEKTHVNADGDLPKDLAENTLNILDGGYVEALRATFANETGEIPGGLVKIYGDGLLRLSGDARAQLYAARAAGIFYGNDIASGVAITYDSIGGYTEVYVPEPATMMLLGLGAFGLIRRRK